jgi:hypothetical protein
VLQEPSQGGDREEAGDVSGQSKWHPTLGHLNAPPPEQLRLSKGNLPAYLGFFQFLRNVRHQNAFEQAELILHAALDPAVASKARKRAFVTGLEHFDLLQTPIN